MTTFTRPLMAGFVLLWSAFTLPSSPAKATEPTRFFTLDQPVITTLEDAPADISLVATAIIAQMRSGEPVDTSPVKFATSLMPRLRERSFRYAGFYVDAISVSHILPARSWEAGRRIYGVIQFTDQVGRRAASRFGVEYLLDGEEIYVSDVSLRTVAPPEPDVRLYVLRTDKATRLFQLANGNHLDALGFIAEHALNVSRERGSCDCVLVAVAFDRLPPGARLHAHVSDTRSGEKVMMGTHYVMDFVGWHIAGLSGRLDLSGSSSMALQALLSLPEGEGEAPGPFRIVTSLPVEETK